MQAKIVVGVDLSVGHLGPLRFATWWAAAHGGSEVVAVHVAPASALDMFTEGPLYGDYQERMGENLELVAAELDPRPAHTEVISSPSVEEGLIDACKQTDAQLLVLGRRGVHTGPSWLRLGPIARHFVHRLPEPVVIVPREWAPPKRAPGPVVVMVSPDDPSHVALEAAIAHARALAVPLIVAHAANDPARELGNYMLDSGLEGLRATRVARDREALDEWLGEQKLPNDAEIVFELSSAHELAAELTKTRRPCVVVVGSRRLSVRDRWFGSSTSTDLAAHLDVPVLIVATAHESA